MTSQTEKPIVAARPFRGRVLVHAAGEVIADSRSAIALDERGHDRVFYVPREDVRTDLLIATESATTCPHKGQARYWSIRAGGRTIADAVWAYDEPLPQAASIARHMAFYPDRVDAIVASEE